MVKKITPLILDAAKGKDAEIGKKRIQYCNIQISIPFRSKDIFTIEPP